MNTNCRSVLLIMGLVFSAFPLNAQTLDVQVERFVSEAKPEFLLGERYKSEDEERVLRRLRALPTEAIQAALRLLANPEEDKDLRRFRTKAFIIGMYRTHQISDSLHQQTASVIFREMIQPRSRPEIYSDMSLGIRFFHDCGDRKDMARLVPLLQHSDPMVKHETILVLKLMALKFGVPDPTAKPPSVPAPPEGPPPPPPVVPVENKQN